MMLTVFTPTYNRVGCLPRLYDSLVIQSERDFEWLIVDDGSTDNTAQIVEEFIRDGKLRIRYFRKENGGKHTAYNYGLDKAEGTYFLCVDADDLLQENAVAHIKNVLQESSGNMGVTAYKKDLHGKRLSGEFPEDVKHCRINELPLKYGCFGEFTFVFPMKIAEKYPFPVFERERFVGENVVYDRIDPVCEMILLAEDITICEYQEDGYSQNFDALLQKNPKGFALYFMQRIDVYPSFKQKIITAGKYWCFRWMGGKPSVRYTGKHRVLTGLCLPLGLVFRVYYKLVRGF